MIKIPFIKKPKRNFYLMAIAFTSGLSIMALEISSSRLLAPYFGTSLFVWTNIIGVVMIALSLGYYLGGKLADKRPELKTLLTLILIAGLIFLIIPWLIKPIASWVSIDIMSFQSALVTVFVGSFLITLILFFLPLMLLGMVSPFIIKLYSLSEKNIGKAAGNVFAVSTIGSILGTFLPTLWLIPSFGTRATIIFFAIILIVLAAVGLAARKSFLFLLIFLIAPLVFVNKISIKSAQGIIFEDESAYQYIQIRQDEENNRYLIFNEGGGTQSVYNEKQILSGDMHYDYFNILPYLINHDQNKQVLIVGLAGGTISRQLSYFRPDIKIDGVEIDEKVIEASKKYLALQNPNLTIFNQDGRIFLQQTDKKYNIIIIDAYSRELYIPWTMTTKEFWQLTKDKLTKDGIIAININSTSKEAELLSSIANTMTSVFDYVFVAKIDGQEAGNYMVMASDNNLDFSKLTITVDNDLLIDIARQVSVETKQLEFDLGKMVLTDDHAPVDIMTDKMIFRYLINKIW